jgi:hypothetical protein
MRLERRLALALMAGLVVRRQGVGAFVADMKR